MINGRYYRKPVDDGVKILRHVSDHLWLLQISNLPQERDRKSFVKRNGNIAPEMGNIDNPVFFFFFFVYKLKN